MAPSSQELEPPQNPGRFRGVQIRAKAGANYTVIDQTSQKPPKNLVLKRKGDALLVEEQGEVIANLDAYYSEGAVTFTTDGSFAAADAAAGSVVTAASAPASTLAGGEAIIWSSAAGDSYGSAAPWLAVGAGALVAGAGGGSGGGSRTPAGDTTAPTATITLSSSTLQSEETATLTITFSEAVKNFDNNDVTVDNGTLSQLTTVDGGVTWTATFTPTDGVADATNRVRLNATYNDLAGNTGSAAESANYTIDTTVAIDGLLQDDYIAFAEVFADLNNNGRWDEGEPKTITDENGRFVLESLADTKVTLIAVGGVDTASGVPNNMVYRTSTTASEAQAGSDVVISPLSTLITSIAENLMQKASAPTVTESLLNQAAAILNESLGLNLENPSVLLNFDAVQASSNGNESRTDQDIELLSVNRQISTVVSAVGALLNGADPAGSNVGTVLTADAFASVLVDTSAKAATFSLRDPDNIARIVEGAMTLGNESGVTSDLRASEATDVEVLSSVISSFNTRIDVATKSDAGPMSADAIAAMVAVSDLMVPLLRNTGGEAASERGGDVSIAGSLQQFVSSVSDAGTAAFVEQKIVAQANASRADFGSQQDVAGYVGDYVPLGIQLPSLGIGDVVDTLVLDLRELAAQAEPVQLFRFDPLLKTYTEIDYRANPAELSVDPRHAGHLFVKASAPMSAQDGLFDGLVEIPVTAANTVGGVQTIYNGQLTITVRDRPLNLIATITAVQDDVAGPAGSLPQTIARNGLTNDGGPLVTGTLNAILPDVGEGGEFYALELYDGSALLGRATVDGTNWFFQTGGLSDGVHSFTARVTFKEPDGDVITLNWASRPYVVTVDTIAPAAPALDVSAGRVVTGTAEAGAAVTIVRKGEGDAEDAVLGTVVADQDGRWMFTPVVRIADSAQIAAYAVDPAGNKGPESRPLNIDWVAPTQLVTISAMTDDFAPATGNVANGGTTNDDRPVITGTISAPLGDRESLVVYREGSDQALEGTLTFDGANWRFASSELAICEQRTGGWRVSPVCPGGTGYR